MGGSVAPGHARAWKHVSTVVVHPTRWFGGISRHSIQTQILDEIGGRLKPQCVCDGIDRLDGCVGAALVEAMSRSRKDTTAAASCEGDRLEVRLSWAYPGESGGMWRLACERPACE